MDTTQNIWSGGQLIAFSGIDGKTDFEKGLTLRVAERGYSLEVRKPNARLITYTGKRPKNIELIGDYFKLDNSYGVLCDCYNLLLVGEFDCHFQAGLMDVEKLDNYTLVAPKGFLNKKYLKCDITKIIKARLKFLNEVTPPKNLSPNSTKSLLKAISQIKTQIYAPEGCITHFWSTPDRWPHANMWLWDSVFHAIGMRNIDISLARELISAMFETQNEDGFIPLMANIFSKAEQTQPPILGLGIKMLNEIEYDEEWTNKLIPKLEKYLDWIFANRDKNQNGLVEWFMHESTFCRCGESGMDNSPRFDSGKLLDAVDFNSYLALECEIVAKYSFKNRKYWLERHNSICSQLNKLCWNNELKFYVDYNQEDKTQTNILASSGFLPLICGACSQEQAQELRNHLYNKDTFSTPFKVSSIAICQSKYYSKDMWRGPVWININWLIAYGLKRYGFDKEAKDIIEETIKVQEYFYNKYGTFFEFYDDKAEYEPPELLRKPSTSVDSEALSQPLRDFGWSATLYIDMIYNR